MGGGYKSPSGTALEAPTRTPLRRAHKSAEAGLGPRGRGAGQSVRPGEPHLEGQGSLPSRAEQHPARWDPPETSSDRTGRAGSRDPLLAPAK